MVYNIACLFFACVFYEKIDMLRGELWGTSRVQVRYKVKLSKKDQVKNDTSRIQVQYKSE